MKKWYFSLGAVRFFTEDMKPILGIRQTCGENGFPSMSCSAFLGVCDGHFGFWEMLEF